MVGLGRLASEADGDALPLLQSRDMGRAPTLLRSI